MIDSFVEMGFDRETVVDTFLQCRIANHGGRKYELGPEQTSEITARLLREA